MGNVNFGPLVIEIGPENYWEKTGSYAHAVRVNDDNSDFNNEHPHITADYPNKMVQSFIVFLLVAALLSYCQFMYCVVSRIYQCINSKKKQYKYSYVNTNTDNIA